MRALNRKLLRDVRRMWAQSLAIALVMAAGAATLILGIGAHDSLSTTRQAYYDANRFADLFVNLTRAPEAIANDIARLDGVAAVEPRIVKIAMTDLPGMAEPAAVQLVSLAPTTRRGLNEVYLRNGRIPDSGQTLQALASADFAAAHGLRAGGKLALLLNGRRVNVHITGTALSPEFIYVLGPGAMMPDPKRFGVLWLPRETLAAAYDLEGAFSNLAVKLAPGVSATAVMAEIDKRLTRYGGAGTYDRKEQISHAFLDSELQQLRAMSRILPPIFLLVAAFLVNMTLSRLIALEREQIGLLKAMGYSSWAIARHYVAFVTLIALIGVVIGFAAGTFLGREMAQLYAKFFSFPFLVFSQNPATYAISAVITTAAAITGALKAVWDVAWLPPAVAMSPPAPARYRKFLPTFLDLRRLVRTTTLISSRHLLHWPWRSGSGILGTSFAVSILVASLWSFGSLEHVIDISFHRSDRQDATVYFTSPRPLSALQDARHLPGILAAEPFRAVAVQLRNGHRERRVAIMGKVASAELTRTLDAELHVVTMPSRGLVISSALASILNLRVGDMAEVETIEGERRKLLVPVTAIVTGFFGLSVSMELAALNRLLYEQPTISGVNVSIDQAQQDKLYAALKNTPVASFIVLQKTALQRFRETLAENINAMVTVYVALAGIIAFGVVYNFARISLSEQGRELASLRVLGFTRGEVSALLLAELALVVLLAQPLGWVIGYGFALLMVEGFTSELYRVPLVVGSSVYAYASLVVIAAAAVSALIVRRRIDRLDMIAVLKTRE